MSCTSIVSAEEFGRLVAEKRDVGAHPSEAYRAVARELLATQMDTDQAEYPFANVNYLSGGPAVISVMFSSPEPSADPVAPIEWQTTDATAFGKNVPAGLKWDLVNVAGAAAANKRAPALTANRVTISLALGSGDKKRSMPVASIDLKELWDSSLEGLVVPDGNATVRPGYTKATFKLPMLSAYQLATAARHALPSVVLAVKCTLTWPAASAMPKLIVNKVAVELEWITRPEMATQPIDGNIYQPTSDGRSLKMAAMNQQERAAFGTRRGGRPSAVKQFNTDQLAELQQQLTQHGANVKAMAVGRAGFVPLVVHTSTAPGEADKLRRLGNVSQLIAAAAIIHHVALSYQVDDNEQLQQLLDDPATLAKMLTDSDSVRLLQTLDDMYGGRQSIPSISSLLAHTSGLPHALTETPAVIESMLEPNESYRRRYSDDQTEMELFSILLLESLLLSRVDDRAYLESPVGFAILRFALPNHDLTPVLGRFLQNALGIQSDDYLLNKPSKYDGNNRRRSPVYAAYDGLSMSTDALLAFTQNPNWYGPANGWRAEPKGNANSNMNVNFADSCAWLSLLHLNLARFGGQKNAAFGLGQLFVSVSKGKKMPNESAEQRQERKRSHVPALKLISSDRNVCILMLPLLNASAVIFHRKNYKNKKSAYGRDYSVESMEKKPQWRPSPQQLTAAIVKHAYRFLMNSEGAVCRLRELSRYGSDRLPPLSQTPESRAAADQIRQLRERQQPFAALRQLLPTVQEPWHAVMSNHEDQGHHSWKRVTAGFESDHPDGSLVLALSYGRQVTRFELFWDQTDGYWYAVDPVTHLRGDVLEIHRLRPSSEDFAAEETVIMFGFRRQLFASYGVVEKIAAMFEPSGKTAAKFAEDYRLQQERKKAAKRLQYTAAWEARSRSAANEDMSSGDEAAAPSLSDRDDDDSSSSSDSDSDSDKRSQRRSRSRRQRSKSSSAASKKQRPFSLLEALNTGFTKKGAQRRFQGPTERNVGEWNSSFVRSTTLASILAFPTEKLAYPSSIYMGLMGDKHKGMVPVESADVQQ